MTHTHVSQGLCPPIYCPISCRIRFFVSKIIGLNLFKSSSVIRSFGADMLITACPLCKYNLNKNASSELPVYYFTELLAEALGVKEEVAK